MRVAFGDSSRTLKARIAAYLTKKPIKIILFTLEIALILGALTLLFFGLFGWGFLFGCAVLFWAFRQWISGDLQNNDGSLPGDTAQVLIISESASSQLLKQLDGSESSPLDIWHKIGDVDGVAFMLSKFKIHPGILNNLSRSPEKVDSVWLEALDLARKSGLKEIDGSVLAVSLFNSLDDAQNVKAQIGLADGDLESGLLWRVHILEVVEDSRRRRSNGGIARDWSNGYTPLLERISLNISKSIENGFLVFRDKVPSQEAVVARMVDALSSPGSSNIALVGASGVGKTTVVDVFAKKLLEGGKNVPESIRYSKVLRLEASTIISSLQNNVSIETLTNRLFYEARKSKNSIIYMDHAYQFFQSGTGAIDLTEVLVPILEDSGQRIVFSFSKEDWQRLVSNHGNVANLINYQVVTELSQSETLAVLENHAFLLENKHRVVFTFQALKEAYRLAERYIHDVAFPGRAVRLLDGAIQHASEHGLIDEQAIQRNVEQMLGVKVQSSGIIERETLLNLEQEIHKRMIGQSRAVQVVSDALRRSRSGVSNPNKPIGTFLFLGPTGVGKTELSKAMSEVFFDGNRELIRLNLNDYVRAEDVSRLTDVGADGAPTLIAQIRERPYSVILLDEIEKAHPSVLTALLQVLDEGVMIDSRGQQSSFRDSVIVATSNAGADAIRKNIENGYTVEQFEERFIDGLIDSNIFKPEFINRFDEVVLFQPLREEDLMAICDLLVQDVNLSLQRQQVSVNLSESAKLWLVRKDYDPRLGARPLRRTVQRTVQNIVAQKLLSKQLTPGSTLELTDKDLLQYSEMNKSSS